MARPGIARRQALRGLGIPPEAADVLLNQSTELASEVESEDSGPGGGLTNPLTDNLDADGFRITNLPKPIDSAEPIRLAELTFTLGFIQATDPSDIADPASATAEDVANKLNALMAAMRASGVPLLGEPT